MKKTISGFIILTLLLASVCTNISAKSNGLKMVKYDYATGESSFTYVDDAIKGKSAISPAYNVGDFIVEPKSIIGTDDRVIVDPNNSPYSRVLCLRMGFDLNGDNVIETWTQATGSMVYSDVMLTCAHALYWYSYGKTAKQMRVYVKQNGTTLNTTYYLPQSWILPSQFINSNDSNYDWCVLKMQDSIGNTTGWFGYGYASSISNKSITVSGYPDISGERYYQYKATGIMNSISSYRFSHNADTLGGQSGASAFDSNGIIWGVHTSGGTSLNYGCLVTSTVYNSIESMK